MALPVVTRSVESTGQSVIEREAPLQTVADPLQPSMLKLGVGLRYHLKAYENTNGTIRAFF